MVVTDRFHCMNEPPGPSYFMISISQSLQCIIRLYVHQSVNPTSDFERVFIRSHHYSLSPIQSVNNLCFGVCFYPHTHTHTHHTPEPLWPKGCHHLRLSLRSRLSVRLDHTCGNNSVYQSNPPNSNNSCIIALSRMVLHVDNIDLKLHAHLGHSARWAREHDNLIGFSLWFLQDICIVALSQTILHIDLKLYAHWGHN